MTLLSDLIIEKADVTANTAASHAQGTDQGLDTGGGNAVTAAQAKSAYTHSGVTTGNPHSVNYTDVGADAAGTATDEAILWAIVLG